MTTTAATVSYYSGTYHGRPDQVRRVRAAVAGHLAGYPAADDALLIVSEVASNAIRHSNSKDEFFTVRVQAYPDYLWIECEDLGGEWHPRPGDDRPHGLDIIQALTGPGNWGIETTSDGDRVVWARLDLPSAKQPHVPDPARPPDASTLTPGELERTRRELAAALALARPGSPAQVPIRAHLDAIDAELARRATRRP